MPLISREEWEKDWRLKHRSCLYPIFDSWGQSKVPLQIEPGAIRNFGRKLIRNLKTLLLFHDGVDCGLHYLFLPQNPQFARLLRYPWFVDEIFELHRRHLLISGTPIGREFEASVKRSILEQSAANVGDRFFDARLLERFLLNDGLMFPFHDGGQAVSQGILESICDELKENTFELEDEAVGPLLELASGLDVDTYSSVIRFVREIVATDDPSIRRISSRLAMRVYEVGDKYPARQVVPYMGQAYGDSPLRESSILGGLVITRSPIFFRTLLEILIGKEKARKVATLPASFFVELHAQPFWAEFTAEISEACSAISKSLSGLTAEEISQAMRDEIESVFQVSRKNTANLVEFAYGTTFVLIGLPFLLLSPATVGWYEGLKQQAHLRLFHKCLFDFTQFVSKALLTGGTTSDVTRSGR